LFLVVFLARGGVVLRLLILGLLVVGLLLLVALLIRVFAGLQVLHHLLRI
jgi:hypothetical protein